MKYIWILSLLFSQIAWSAEGLKGDAVQLSDLVEIPPFGGPDSDLYVEIPPLNFLYYCHYRGSLTSELITSSNPNQEKACASHNMKSGQAFPMIYNCSDKNGDTFSVYSSLSKEEACVDFNTAPRKRFSKIDLEPFLRYILPQTPETINLKQNEQPIMD